MFCFSVSFLIMLLISLCLFCCLVTFSCVSVLPLTAVPTCVPLPCLPLSVCGRCFLMVVSPRLPASMPSEGLDVTFSFLSFFKLYVSHLSLCYLPLRTPYVKFCLLTIKTFLFSTPGVASIWILPKPLWQYFNFQWHQVLKPLKTQTVLAAATHTRQPSG